MTQNELERGFGVSGFGRQCMKTLPRPILGRGLLMPKDALENRDTVMPDRTSRRVKGVLLFFLFFFSVRIIVIVHRIFLSLYMSANWSQ